MRLMSCAGRLCSAPVWKARIRRWIKEKISEIIPKTSQMKREDSVHRWFRVTEKQKDEGNDRKNIGMKRKREFTYNGYDSEGSIAFRGCKRSSRR
jgi:hypothetical protein